MKLASEVTTALAERGEDEATAAALAGVHQLINWRLWWRLDGELASWPVEDHPVALLRAMLAATAAVSHRLPSREQFALRVAAKPP